jgi:hypothetical protein
MLDLSNGSIILERVGGALRRSIASEIRQRHQDSLIAEIQIASNQRLVFTLGKAHSENGDIKF